MLPYNSAAGAKYLPIGQTYALEHLVPFPKGDKETLAKAG